MSPAESPASPPSNVTSRKVSSSSAAAKDLLAQHQNREPKRLGRNLERHTSKTTATADEQQHVSQSPLYHGFRVPPLLNMDSPSRQLVREAKANKPLPSDPSETFPEEDNDAERDWKSGTKYDFMSPVTANNKGTVAENNTFPQGADAPNKFITDANETMVSSKPGTTVISSKGTAMNSRKTSVTPRLKPTQPGNSTNTFSNTIIPDIHSQIDISPTKTDTFHLLKSIRSTVQDHTCRISANDTETTVPRNKRIVAELRKFLDTADAVEKRLQEIYKETEKN